MDSILKSLNNTHKTQLANQNLYTVGPKYPSKVIYTIPSNLKSYEIIQQGGSNNFISLINKFSNGKISRKQMINHLKNV